MNSTLSFSNQLLIILTAALPLVLGLCYAVRRWQTAFFRLAPWSALPALAVSVTGPFGGHVELTWFLLEIQLGLDTVGCTFLFFTAALWFLSGIYGQRYLATDPRRSRFFFFYLLAMSGNLGLIIAQDMITFYVFFALMSFSSYGLVVHNQDKDALRAGKIYIILVIFGEILLFTALALIFRTTVSLSLNTIASMPSNHLVILLVLVGFGIKAGALPLHVWLPLAHPAAPTPASAVLSGAMIKAGLLGWLRFLPWGQPGTAVWGSPCIVAGMLAAFLGVIFGLNQKNPKTLLAYSSISQMGLMTAGIGIGLSLPDAAPLVIAAVSVYAVHHGFAKGALFLSVGFTSSTTRNYWMRVFLTGGTGLAALALAGAPFTSGMIAKTALKSTVDLLEGPWSEWLNFLLPFAAVGTSLLMICFLRLIRPDYSKNDHLSAGLWLPWMFVVILVIFAVWYLTEARLAVSKALNTKTLWVAAWPVGLSVGLYSIFYLFRRKSQRKIEHIIPAGDILAIFDRIPLEPISNWLQKLLQIPGVLKPHIDGVTQRFSKQFIQRDLLDRLEQRLVRWPVAGILFTGIVCAFLFMLAVG
jgi:formate hydrogenlyase subunit 3/multisubunit Na+/H+ antiporter MnhD subunit